MTITEQLQEKVAELQTALDAEQVQIAEAIAAKDAAIAEKDAANEALSTANAALQVQVETLQALVDAAPTPEQLQAVVDGLTAVQTDLEGTV